MKTSLLTKFAFMLSCALFAAAAAFAQGPGQQGRILLRPQRGTLMEGNGGCTIDSLNLRFTTGTDDLRGGQNNLSVEIHYAKGDMQTASNVNKGVKWPNRSVNAVAIPLNHPVAPGDIKQIRLIHSAQAGFNPRSDSFNTALAGGGPPAALASMAGGVQSEDNWDMAEVQAFGLGKGTNIPIAHFGAHRFTGSDPALSINAQPGAACPAGNQVTKISFTFQTADDDLRGGDDNLNITVLFLDGAAQPEPDVNHSQNWPNGSTRGAEILLDRPVTMDQIRGFTLADTFGGGSGGDNWNMASMQADAFLADGSHHTIAKVGFHRFSADTTGSKAREIRIPAHPIN